MSLYKTLLVGANERYFDSANGFIVYTGAYKRQGIVAFCGERLDWSENVFWNMLTDK
jgi:hypothetical protein